VDAHGVEGDLHGRLGGEELGHARLHVGCSSSRGLIKFVIDADTDLILGAALISIDSQEVINLVAFAMRHDVPASELGNSLYSHPSTTEGFNELLGTVARVPSGTVELENV
jgi:pyruvate/2-oxoglutarate dehydrogenase complex dihydrolipoamide dehydrogenase (E3) component